MDWTRMNDGELAERFALEGEDEPFRELVRRHGAMVLRVCRRVTSNPHDAEDAAQHVFVILCARASELASSPSLAGWLYSTAWHVGRRMQRSESTRQRYEANAVREEVVDGNGHADADVLRELYRAIEMLPTEYCEAIALYHLQGMTVQQVAELMSCSAGTTAARLSRGRAMLRERLSRRGMVLSAAALEAVLVAEAMHDARLEAGVMIVPPTAESVAAITTAQYIATQRAVVIPTASIPFASATGTGLSLLTSSGRRWIAAICLAGGVACGIGGASAIAVSSDHPEVRKVRRDLAREFTWTPASTGVAPEPASLSLFGFAALALRRHGRRRI